MSALSAVAGNAPGTARIRRMEATPAAHRETLELHALRPVALVHGDHAVQASTVGVTTPTSTAARRPWWKAPVKMSAGRSRGCYQPLRLRARSWEASVALRSGRRCKSPQCCPARSLLTSPAATHLSAIGTEKRSSCNSDSNTGCVVAWFHSMGPRAAHSRRQRCAE